jgi:hypothetical protein
LDHGESLSSQRYSRRRIHKVARVSEIKGREELHETLCVRIHQQHSCLLQVRAKQRWIWLKSIRLLKHLLLLLLHHHHLAGVSPCKKIQRLKRLCRSSAIRAVMMEKLWYLRFCVSPALLVLSSVVCNQNVDYFIVFGYAKPRLIDFSGSL